MIRALFASVILAVVLPAQPQNGDLPRGRMARAIKIIPVPHLVHPIPRAGRIPFSTMIDCAPEIDFSHRSFLEDNEDPRPRIDNLTDILREITPLSWDGGDVSADLIGDALLVTGSPDQIHLVEQSLQQLTAALGGPFTVRAATFTLAAEAELPTSGAPYGELRARLGQLGATFLWESTATAEPSQTVDLGSLATVPYVSDCDVEIAQSSTMANPITVPMHLGALVQVQAHPLAGSSDAVLLVQYARGETAAPIREIVLGKDDALPRLQSPTVAADTGCFSGRIENGGALVFLADGEWGGHRLGILVAAERAAVPADAERGLGVFPLGAFLSAGLRRDFYVPEDSEWRDLWTPPVVVEEDSGRTLYPSSEETWQTLFHRAIDEDDCAVMIWNHLAIVQGPAAAKQTVARLIELMQEQFLRTVDVELRLANGDGRGAPLQRVRFPVLQGRHHCVVHGIESTGIADADVEVAQKAGVSDPKVVRHFTGSMCAVQVYPLANDLGAVLRLRIVDTVPTRTYVPENKRGLPLDQPTITRSRHVHQGRVPTNGQPIAFGDGPAVMLNDHRQRSQPQIVLRAR
ncbi:MAG: hypothetical protein R3F56_15800 [Planctomycetota bacterium]